MGMANFNLGIEGTVGAKLDIGYGTTSFYKKELDPIGIISYKKPLYSGCWIETNNSTDNSTGNATTDKSGAGNRYTNSSFLLGSFQMLRSRFGKFVCCF